MAMMETWQAMSSFLTPAALFLLLNLVIATIVLSSRRHQHHFTDPSAGPLYRTTSPVIESLRTFTLQRFRSGEIPSIPSFPNYTQNYTPSGLSSESGPDPTIESSSRSLDDAFKAASSSNTTISNSPPSLGRTSSILDRLKSISLYRFRSGEIQTHQVQAENTDQHQHQRSQSEPSRLDGAGADGAKSEKKKKKTKKTTSAGEGEVVRRRRELAAVVVEEEEEEVDARADDFISKFKENLKIQRLNSILNYTEMLNRGR